MEFRDSALYREVANVINSGANPVHYTVSGYIVVNGTTAYPLVKIISIDSDRNYLLNYHDSPIVKALVPMGTYHTGIYPYMDNLTVVLRRTPIGAVSDEVNYSQSVQEEAYYAHLHGQGSPYLEQNQRNEVDQTSMDLSAMIEITIELIPLAAQQIRMMMVSPGTLRNTTTDKALRTILTAESAKIQVDTAYKITGVDMVPGNNQTPRDHIQIPHGITLGNIPVWIHEQQGGIYSAGLGYYLQGQMWYVYPLFDPTRDSSQTACLTIINVPKNQFPGVEITYMTSGDHTTILSTGDTQYRDVSPQAQLNQGSGARWTDASTMIGGFTQTVDNKTVAYRAKVNNEVQTIQRPDGMNYTPVSGSRITANPFYEYSKLAQRDGAYFTLTWENSEPNLVKPGMLARVLYMNQGQVAQVDGVVLRASHIQRMAGKGMTNTRYVSDSAITLFVKRAMANGFAASNTVST